MESSFKFKQFTVINGKSGLKVGTDGVLLGAATTVKGDEKRILDIGTGTGVIALMLAQRTADTRITGIDIEEEVTAGENFASSPWADRLEYVNISLGYYADSGPGLFDLIVSNPPYYDDSLLCPDHARSEARHTESLSYREVITFANDFLSEDGSVAVITPKSEEARLNRFAASFGFFPIRAISIRTTAAKAPLRLISEFSRHRSKTSTEVLTISDGDGYTSEYKELTKDFYLNF